MEWKKIVGMEYGKIVFHSIPLHALGAGTCYAGKFMIKLHAVIANVA